MPQFDVQKLADEAWSLAEGQKYAEANAVFARLCELRPDNPEVWMMRGATQMELGDSETAATYLRKALELDPDYADPCLHLGKLALNTGRLDEARRLADQAVGLDPGYVVAWVLRVVTPSFEHVRQPLYRKSIGRWKNYEGHMGPLVAALKQ